MALVSITACSEINKEHAIAENNKGIEFLEEREYEKAVAQFKKANEKTASYDVDKITFIRNIVNTYHEIGMLDSSIHYSKELLQLCEKKSYDYYATLGDIKILEDKVREGVKNLKIATRIQPFNLEANNTLGMVYLGEYGMEYANYDRALKYNQAAYDFEPSSTLKSVLARNYYYLDELEHAEEMYQGLLDEYENDLDYLYSLGLTKYELEKKEEAKTLFEQVYQEDSTYFEYDQEMLLDLGILTE